MNGATSDVERGMLWRSRIARHCDEIDYRVYRERIRDKIRNNDDEIMNAYGNMDTLKKIFTLLIKKIMHHSLNALLN